MDRQERLQYRENRGFALPKVPNFNYLCKKAIPIEQCKFNTPKRYFSVLAIILLFSFITTPLYAEPIKLTASWYSTESLKKEGTYKYSKGVMANGKLFDENALTCASCDFSLKTKLRITTVKAPKKSIIVEVTDRTNRRFKGKRIDLSKRAFGEIANLKQGLCQVSVTRAQ